MRCQNYQCHGNRVILRIVIISYTSGNAGLETIKPCAAGSVAQGHAAFCVLALGLRDL